MPQPRPREATPFPPIREFPPAAPSATPTPAVPPPAPTPPEPPPPELPPMTPSQAPSRDTGTPAGITPLGAPAVTDMPFRRELPSMTPTELTPVETGTPAGITPIGAPPVSDFPFRAGARAARALRRRERPARPVTDMPFKTSLARDQARADGARLPRGATPTAGEGFQLPGAGERLAEFLDQERLQNRGEGLAELLDQERMQDQATFAQRFGDLDRLGFTGDTDEMRQLSEQAWHRKASELSTGLATGRAETPSEMDIAQFIVETGLAPWNALKWLRMLRAGQQLLVRREMLQEQSQTGEQQRQLLTPDRGALDQFTSTTRVQGNAQIDINVTRDSASAHDPTGGGLFLPIAIDRQTQMAPAQVGPRQQVGVALGGEFSTMGVP
jgi:hypothetical protein